MLQCTKANGVDKRYKLSARLCTFITLARYTMLPSTFTSLKNSSSLEKIVSSKILQKAVQSIEVLTVASILCCIGIVGNCYL
jgi:hypothetical protein